MDNVDGIKSIFPKYKQQLLFLRERERLFNLSSALNENKENEIVTLDTSHSSSYLANSISMDVVASTPKKTQSSYDVHRSSPVKPLTHEIPVLLSPNVIGDCSSKIPLLDSYRLNSLPSSLLKDIDSGDLSKFNSHCKNRQILIDAVFYDLTTNYNIWYVIHRKTRIFSLIDIQRWLFFCRYPSHQEYDVIVDAILDLLKTQKSKENMVSETVDHGESSFISPSSRSSGVKPFRRSTKKNDGRTWITSKYECTGRSTRVRNLGDQWRRKWSKLPSEIDRNKCVGSESICVEYVTFILIQIFLPQLADNGSIVDVNEKLAQLRNQSALDDATVLHLWGSTMQARRRSIRNKTTEEIMSQYPEYSSPALVCHVHPSHFWWSIIFVF